MKYSVSAFLYTAFFLMAILSWPSCKKEVMNDLLTPNDTIVVTNNTNIENSKMEAFLNAQPEPSLPEPNQYNLISSSTNSLGDTVLCTERIVSETSPEHAEMLLPKPTDIYIPGWTYQLNSLINGEDEPIVKGIGGKRTLTLRAGAYADSITTGYQSHEVLTGISELLSNLNDHSQDFEFSVEEVYSARQAAAKIKASYNGIFADFASSFDFDNQEYAHRFLVVMRIHDFDVDVSHPERPFDWFPSLDSTEYGGVFGSYAPVYVDKISYGKYLLMMVETDYSKTDLHSTIDASFSAVFSGGGFDASGEYHNLRTSSRIKIQAIGGDATSYSGLLTGDPSACKSYLESIAADKSGTKSAPLFCQFRFLKDNSRAKVVLATDQYKVRDCQVIPAESITWESDDYFEYPVDLVYGDGEYGGDGFPYVYGKIKLELRNHDTEVWLINDVGFYELRSDYTTGIIDDERKLPINLPAGKKITRIISPTLYNIEYNDYDLSPEIFPVLGEYPANTLVSKLFINGDTKNTDLPSEHVHSDRSWMKFRLNKVILEVR